MILQQGNLALLNEPLAQELLHAAIPARLAYVWSDGTPRVMPIWFQWTGEEVVLCSPQNAPKMKILAQDTQVALTIDYEAWPARVLLIRGPAHSETIDGEIPEYAEMTTRYLGEEAGKAWRAQYRQMFPQPVRIAVKPEWVGLVDVETRLPSAIAKAIANMQSRERFVRFGRSIDAGLWSAQAILERSAISIVYAARSVSRRQAR